MKTFQINLGMNNNPHNLNSILDFFTSHFGIRLMAYYVKDKTFFGEVEPTFCAMFEYTFEESQLLAMGEYWCTIFTQESIAISSDKMEVLAFNKNFKGEAYRFDSSLFEYIKR